MMDVWRLMKYQDVSILVELVKPPTWYFIGIYISMNHVHLHEEKKEEEGRILNCLV
jgi:hypothetical protein